MPEVSVIMSVYNGMPYLPLAVESILSQTLPDLELIVVNDCSTDASLACLQTYTDSRLRILNLPENEGQTRALNHGLRAATGKYIARQDADDISKPERLARQAAYLDAHSEVWLLGTSGDLINSAGQILGQEYKAATDADVREQYAQNQNPFFHGSVMFRREVLEQVGYYREGFRTSQDYDYWRRIAEHGQVGNLPEPLYQYRLHEGQMTFTSYYRMKAEWKLAHELAQVRAQNNGDDSAAYATGAQQLTDTFTHFVPTRAQKRRAMAEFWRGKGVSHMNSGNYPRMAYCLLRAFLFEPDNPDFWRGVRNHLPGKK